MATISTLGRGMLPSCIKAESSSCGLSCHSHLHVQHSLAAGAATGARAMVGSRVGLNLGVLRRCSALQAAGARRKHGGRTGGGVARAVWKQEVLWAEAPVAEIGNAAEQLYHVVLDISGNRELIEGHTKAGQFVQVRIGNSKPAFLAIASPPKISAKGSLEFLIKSVEGTTAGVLCSLGKGDKVELSQVLGNGFQVEQVAPAEEFPTVLLFATGSGISPIRSLLEAGFDAHRRQDVRLYYGAHNLKRMAYQDKFREWEASGVKVVPVLSAPDDGWTGEQGYVQAAFAKAKDITNAAQAGAFLCGQKEMAQDVTSLLLADGVSKDRILLNF